MKGIQDFINEREYESEIGWIDHDTFGIVFFEEQRIIINLYLLICETFIHEWMHTVFPDMEEKWIIRLTRRYMQKQSIEDIRATALYILGFAKWG